MCRFFKSSGHLGLIAVLVMINLTACKKFVETSPPPTEIAGATVYSNNSSAAAVMTGLYSDMIQYPGMSSGALSIGWFMGLSADELTNYDPTNPEQVQFYQNALSSFSNGGSNYYFWTELYSDIYVNNAVLAGLSNSSGVTDSVKRQLSGEAEFMRAFLHFYATNLYGDVPLVTTTNYQVNNSISRTPQAQVYQQIVVDLLDAQSKLSATFVDGLGNPSTDRIRPNQGAATALLARVYLYTGKWDSAEAAATTVINNSGLYSLDSVNNVFLANSTEAIWQLQPNQPGNNTWDAISYVLQGVPGPGQSNSVAVSSNLTSTFEANDERFANWLGLFTNNNVNYYYPYKYKVWQNGLPLTEYTIVLRLAEQYLIRAEAEANLGDSTDAINDLNVIRNRAALPNYTSAINGPLLTAILHERQVELFSEWGHRWFDLKRTGNLNSVMGAPGNACPAKGGAWNTDWALLPIALQELKINPHLTQNPGY
jgi:starch-binding outer membrane protein, SusD/RagB family